MTYALGRTWNSQCHSLEALDVAEQVSYSGGAYPGFEVDGMLGGLAKWLRILGFDVLYPSPLPSGKRLFVTKKKRAVFGCTIRIRSQKPIEQATELLEQIRIRPDPAMLMSRCLECNVPVRSIEGDRVRGRVPDRICRLNASFTECPQCGRVYWQGSHVSRIREKLADSWDSD